MNKRSIFDAFGVISPNTDTKKVPVSAICKTGKGTNQREIPFVFDFQNLRRILRNIDKNIPVFAHGPSGCGKTELFCQIGARLNRPVHVISFGEESSIREMMGTVKLTNSLAELEGNGSAAQALWAIAKRGLGMSTKFEYGQLPKAIMDEDAIVVLDELNMAPPGITAQLNRFLETNQIVIAENGEIVKAAKNVSIVATSNVSGSIDESGIYAGSQIMNGATRSRFAYIELSYMGVDDERAILLKRIPSLDEIKLPGEKLLSSLAVDLAGACRALVEEGSVSLPFTVRNLIRFGEATIDLRDVRSAFRDAYYDGLSQEEKIPVSQVFHKIIGLNI